MTQEEKELLLKDLCARLPYRVKCVYILGDTIWSEEPETIENIDLQKGKIWTNNTVQGYNIEDQDFKPYLRPMSSMTEEEKKKLKEDTCPNGTGYFDEKYLICPMSHYGEQISYGFMSNILEWLNAHHFDYRHLIEKGLALEAPEDMYKV